MLCTVRQAPAASGAGEVEAPPRAQAVRARREPRSIRSERAHPAGEPPVPSPEWANFTRRLAGSGQGCRRAGGSIVIDYYCCLI